MSAKSIALAASKAKIKVVAKVATKAVATRLNPKQWAELEALWEIGAMTRKSMAEKFNTTERSIQRHMLDKKIVRGSKSAEHRDKINEAVVEIQVDEATILAARIRETKEEHYKMVSGLGKLAWAEILKAKQEKSPLAVAMNSLKAINEAITIIKKAREEKWALLGLDKDTYIDEDGIPELLISELTAEEVVALRARNHTEFDDDGMSESPVQDGELDDELDDDVVSE
jgi:hypothetical protein